MVKCEFSLKHYFETLSLYKKAGYTISPVSEYFKTNIKHKHLLLRHDIDLSLDYAYILAVREAANEIKSSYYVLLHSPHYNALSPKGMEAIRQIKELGHEIGLHVDSRYHLSRDFDTLDSIIDEPIWTWSQHLVSETPRAVDLKYSAQDDALEPTRNGFKYLSDSGQHWREGCFCNHIDKYDKIEILTHPCSWFNPDVYKTMDIMAQMSACQIARDFDEHKSMVKKYVKALCVK